MVGGLAGSKVLPVWQLKRRNVLVINDKRHQPEKQQLCLFEVRTGFNFLGGVFCALVRIFLTPLMTQVW